MMPEPQDPAAIVPAVQVLEIEKTFVLGTNAVPALRGVSMKVMPGEFVAVMGPSGCGKTTLLNLVGLLDSPTRGAVFIDGRDVSSLSDNETADLRRDKLGFVFQFYNLLPMLTASENIEIPLNFKGLGRDERAARVEELLARVGLAGRSHHLPAELSGGEQQRVTIARALANKPTIVLLDEPTGDLDSKTGDEIMELVFRLNREEGTTFIMVTHDAELAAKAGRIVTMKDGKIIGELPGGSAPQSPAPAGDGFFPISRADLDEPVEAAQAQAADYAQQQPRAEEPARAAENLVPPPTEIERELSPSRASPKAPEKEKKTSGRKSGRAKQSQTPTKTSRKSGRISGK